MATDNNNKLASNKETLPDSTVKSGGSTGKASRFFKPKISQKNLVYLILAALCIIIIASAGWAILKKEFHIGEKVYAQAAGHKVYVLEIKQTIKGTPEVGYHQAATVLADKYLTEAMGKQDGVSVTDQDIEATYGKSTLAQKQSQPYYYQQKVNQIYMRKLNAYNVGIYKGEFLIANFSRNVPYSSPLLAEQKAADPNLGNSEAIAKDKKYAHDFITKLYNQIISKKISFSHAIQSEHKDPVIGIEAYPTQPHSGLFDTSSGYGSLLTIPSTSAKIKSIKAGTISKPFLGGDTGNGGRGLYYLVVRIDESRGGSSLPFNQYVHLAKQKFGYKVNV